MPSHEQIKINAERITKIQPFKGWYKRKIINFLHMQKTGKISESVDVLFVLHEKKKYDRHIFQNITETI